ncbi:hypothetical protein HPB52_012615 [Rhipicephalus sanguineus]|uniref:CCHC-type domain-containing protein n=1 Tax=Rhipicephalus sanguineus TaxID=34632 RepID=A0A9D4QGK1_RHISA|nr:hypothetical protein HPB52_012615 [Rhipicephalus sanguineus]
MVAEGFKVNHERVAVEAVGPPVTYVNVFRFPAYLADEVLTNALHQYGKVKGVTFATVASRQNKLNGVRVVKMEMSRPVPNFATIQGHRVMFEYRGMRRVCARCGEDGHMATACSSPYCKRCGTFGHETEGCEVDCKRCGGRHGTKDCFRRRSYVAAARGFPPANGDLPNSDQANRTTPTSAPASSSGFQVLRPRTPPPTSKNVPDYWENGGADERDNTSTATASPAPQPTSPQSVVDTGSASTESDLTVRSGTDLSSSESTGDSMTEPRSESEEQEVPQSGGPSDNDATEDPRLDTGNFPPLPSTTGRAANLDDTPIVSCGRYVYQTDHAYIRTPRSPGPSRQPQGDSSSACATTTASAPPPGLEPRHRSRSRQRQKDGQGNKKAEHAGSTETTLRRSKAADGSSDSEAARRTQAKKPRKGSVGDGSPTPRQGQPPQ